MLPKWNSLTAFVDVDAPYHKAKTEINFVGTISKIIDREVIDDQVAESSLSHNMFNRLLALLFIARQL